MQGKVKTERNSFLMKINSLLSVAVSQVFAVSSLRQGERVERCIHTGSTRTHRIYKIVLLTSHNDP